MVYTPLLIKSKMFKFWQVVRFLSLALFFLVVTPASLLAKPPLDFVPSVQRYVYDIAYKNIAVGKVIRELHYQKADRITVNTRADLAFLFYHFGGNQLTDIYWDETSQSFLSKKFVRKSIGFSGGSLQAEFFDGGHQTRIRGDGEDQEFVNKEQPIIDFNVLGLQMSEGLKSGRTDFEFYMQTEDSVAHYFFKVMGKDVIQTKFGQLHTYRIEQTGKDDRQLIVWFAPEINFQIVKFQYKRKLLDLSGVISARSMINL